MEPRKRTLKLLFSLSSGTLSSSLAPGWASSLWKRHHSQHHAFILSTYLRLTEEWDPLSLSHYPVSTFSNRCSVKKLNNFLIQYCVYKHNSSVAILSKKIENKVKNMSCLHLLVLALCCLFRGEEVKDDGCIWGNGSLQGGGRGGGGHGWGWGSWSHSCRGCMELVSLNHHKNIINTISMYQKLFYYTLCKSNVIYAMCGTFTANSLWPGSARKLQPVQKHITYTNTIIMRWLKQFETTGPALPSQTGQGHVDALY